VSAWLDQLKDGDQQAAQKLWERYFRRLVGLARMRLRDAPCRAADEEDVALIAFASFCRGVEEGRFPQLQDRNELWRVLVVLTARKAERLRRHEGQQKRGGLTVGGAGDALLEEIVSREPTPDFAAEVADECRRLLASLNGNLAAVARCKMEGYTNAEIADRLGCSPRTVERKLELIRDTWQRDNPT
jgi:DNA-directed RNA polymerase specialized sigma24 family protein